MNIIHVSPYISFLGPKLSSWIQQTRGLRNLLKIGKDSFELAIDVRHFYKDELQIKARQDRLLIEGKHERKLDKGCIIRQFSRKYKLPAGVDTKKMKSTLSDEGILTITAPRNIRHVDNVSLPCETDIPITIKCQSDGKGLPEASKDVQKCLDNKSSSSVSSDNKN